MWMTMLSTLRLQGAVGEQRRNGHGEARRRGDQRLHRRRPTAHAGPPMLPACRALNASDDADDGAQQSQQRRDRSDGAERVEEALQLVNDMAAGVFQPFHHDFTRSGDDWRGLPRARARAASSAPSAWITLSLIWFDSMSCHTFCGQITRQNRRSCRVQSLSRMIAAAAMEQRMIGHISGPPARTISHILTIPEATLGWPASYRSVPCAQGETAHNVRLLAR